MFAIAKSYSGCHRYIIHPQKTHVVCKQCSSTVDVNAREEWNIGDKSLHLSERTTHLGLARTYKNDCAVIVADRISLARRTGYSLMKSGFHGSNGLNPKVSYRLYQTYVMPRIEILDLRKKDTKQLSDFHIDLLRRIQALPIPEQHYLLYTSSSGPYQWRPSSIRDSLAFCFPYSVI